MLTTQECIQYQLFVNKYQKYLYSLIGSYLARCFIHDGFRVLDLGTGPGDLSREILTRSGATLTGVDINNTMLSLARQNLAAFEGDRWKLLVGDVHELPFESESFDLVVSYSCFHHWNDKSTGLKECYRVAAHGGRILIFDTVRPSSNETLALLRTMISEPELYRFVQEAFDESLTIREVESIAAKANLQKASVNLFSFDEEDLMNCIDELPSSLPLADEENSSGTLWVLEVEK
jgi:ubiquinone/menaquinone biosynthesis C-methylase UbiE